MKFEQAKRVTNLKIEANGKEVTPYQRIVLANKITKVGNHFLFTVFDSKHPENIISDFDLEGLNGKNYEVYNSFVFDDLLVFLIYNSNTADMDNGTSIVWILPGGNKHGIYHVNFSPDDLFVIGNDLYFTTSTPGSEGTYKWNSKGDIVKILDDYNERIEGEPPNLPEIQFILSEFNEDGNRMFATINISDDNTHFDYEVPDTEISYNFKYANGTKGIKYGPARRNFVFSDLFYVSLSDDHKIVIRTLNDDEVASSSLEDMISSYKPEKFKLEKIHSVYLEEDEDGESLFIWLNIKTKTGANFFTLIEQKVIF